MSIPTRDILPNKFTELLLIAMADLEKTENDPAFRIDMGVWVSMNHKCTVCQAGAVMMHTLGVTKEDVRLNGWTHYSLSRRCDMYNISPLHFDNRTALKLQAINCARAGQFISALEHFFEAVHGDDPISWPPIPETVYSMRMDWSGDMDYSTRSLRKRDLWRARMLDAIGILQAEGL